MSNAATRTSSWPSSLRSRIALPRARSRSRVREGARALGLEGTVEPTVDSAKHVNGGCRSLASDGKEWECYIGETAVRQRIISEGLFGEYAPTPGVG
jgi:hypothetical protein